MKRIILIGILVIIFEYVQRFFFSSNLFEQKYHFDFEFERNEEKNLEMHNSQQLLLIKTKKKTKFRI